MQAAMRILAMERRWLSLALQQAEAEMDGGCALLEESRLREQVGTLGRELAEVVDALGMLRGVQAQRREAAR